MKFSETFQNLVAFTIFELLKIFRFVGKNDSPWLNTAKLSGTHNTQINHWSYRTYVAREARLEPTQNLS